ncbi:substrate-binding domain-containing protein [Devosia psychrophila]|uniref:DNA-binding transcriptional regulator, GntR family n=1 Tax=Devosia psychrophila TaxID=728005 RepID=A0A1I1IQE1_9HYPH|nr:DNA-binding transcriptional regulator, GntR family [Devosia psychrophila]
MSQLISLANEVYKTIFSQLMALKIAPGARITVDNLARELGVSQTPIREALGRLEGEGLVHKTHLIGFSAAPQISSRQFGELYELRLLVEPHAAGRVVSKLTDDMLAANWNSDEAFSLMQDYLAKYPHIDAVWANDDDMLLGVVEAIKQSGRTEIKYALGGNGMKEIIEKVMTGDAMTPIETPYPPSMIKTAIYMTAAQFNGQAPVRGTDKLDAPLITKDNAAEYYFPDSPF